jgi:serine/threonine-protein kinase
MGEYEIVRRLRVGGMATLYLARRHGAAGFTRQVALKVIHPHLIELPAVIEMFVDEARICAQLAHPNIVHVEEFGELDGVHFLVMEYLDGCSVADLLQTFQTEQRKLDPELAARVIMQVAAGLHAAHETRDAAGRPLDIVHRDISPSNILLSLDGNAKLIDFGIAKARYRVSETEAGVSLKGKFNYVAPEQATRGPLDRRSDIFALGVVFWEMLTGQPLFPDDSYLSLFNRLHRTEVAAPSTLNPSAPTALDAIVLAMLQHRPDDRPQTAAEVVRWIAAALPGAANRDLAEIGRLATEIRDRRDQMRGFDDSTADAHSFSPLPRRSRTQTSEHRFDLAAVGSRPGAPPGSMPGVGSSSGVIMVLPPSPTPAWRRRPVQIAVAGALGAVVLVVGLFVRGASAPTANASARPPVPMQPMRPPVASPPPLPPRVEAPPPPASEAIAVPAPPPPPPSPLPVHREPARPSITRPSRPTAVRPAAKPVEAASKPAPTNKPASSRDGAPIVNTSFDDENNTAPPSKP